MSKWPPPPDLESIRELVRAADPEGHLYEGAPADEYDPEEQAIFEAIRDYPTEELRADNMLPILEQIWTSSFGHTEAEQSRSGTSLRQIAEQIERFFGPGATPQVRVANRG